MTGLAAAQGLIDIVCRIDPEQRRLYAARLLVGSAIGWVASHVLLIALHESSFFNHVIMLISWWAIILTCVDVIITSDVKVDTADE